MKYKVKEKPFENVSLPDFVSNEYFRVESVKTAVWQYLLDHAKPMDEKNLFVRFYITEPQEFWRRVKARELGKFKRTDLFNIRQKLDNKRIKEKKITDAYFQKIKTSKWKNIVYN